jgi:creatinine amidohydrolase
LLGIVRTWLESIPATGARAHAGVAGRPVPEPVGQASDHRLGLLSRTEVLARIEAGAIVLLPVGALEQHGDHLPIATDALLVETVCLRAAERAAGQPDILVAPALWTGFSPHHVRFGATISLPGELFLRLAGEVLAALRAWAPRTLIVNGHGGNRGPLVTLALETGCPLVSYWELAAADIGGLFPLDGSIGHAGEAETGMMLAAFGGLVGEPGSGFEPPADAELLLPELGESGVIGDPRAARAEAGAAFLDAVVNALVNHVQVVFATTRKGS